MVFNYWFLFYLGQFLFLHILVDASSDLGQVFLVKCTTKFCFKNNRQNSYENTLSASAVSETKQNKVKMIQIIEKSKKNLTLFAFWRENTREFSFGSENHKYFLYYWSFFPSIFMSSCLFLLTTRVLNRCFRFGALSFVSLQVKRKFAGHPKFPGPRLSSSALPGFSTPGHSAPLYSQLWPSPNGQQLAWPHSFCSPLPKYAYFYKFFEAVILSQGWEFALSLFTF